MERKDLTEIFMETAVLFSQRSTCMRKQVGAFIVKDKRIISTGYNGALPSDPHCSSDICDLTQHCKRAIHAECNALLFAGRSGISVIGADLYVTVSPCKKCSEMIILSGIINVFYKEKYREGDEAMALLNQHNIKSFLK